MASPQIVVFALFNQSTGAPLTGQTPSFLTYEDDTGVAITTPTISEIGGGLYKFTPNFTTNHGAAFMIDGGSSASQRYLYGYLRPEDFYIDMVVDIRDFQQNNWELVATGADAGRLIVYEADGVTVKSKYNLTKLDTTSWIPNSTANVKRTKV